MSSKDDPDNSAHSVGKDSPDNSAHSVSNGWDTENILNPVELAFIVEINAKYNQMQKNTEFFRKINTAVEVMTKTIRPIGNVLWSTGKILKRKIEDSFMIAINQEMSNNIDEKDRIENAIARLELIIYNDSFEYFLQKGKSLTYDEIKTYVDMHDGKIKNMIHLAYTLVYKLQGRPVPQIPESLIIMYIVHSQCQPEVDYTGKSYTKGQILRVIEKCLEKTPGSYLPEGQHAVSNSKRMEVEIPGYKFVYNPVTHRWDKKFDDGRVESPTSEDIKMLHQVKPNPFLVQPNVPRNIPAKEQRKSAKRRRKGELYLQEQAQRKSAKRRRKEQVPVQEQSKRTRRSTRKT
jgi:hypothetical protein